jgi:hypothetical protein
MTTVTPVISYDCGCGFRADSWKEAEAHARVTAHQLTIHGRVLVEKPESVVVAAEGKIRRMRRDDEA